MPTRTSGTVAKALRLLDQFPPAGPAPLTVTRLAAATGIHKSTVVRLCATLEGAGYLERQAAGAYVLGPRVEALARARRAAFRLEPAVRAALRELRDRTGESAAFYAIEGDARVCRYRESSTHPIRHHVEEGARLPLEAGVVGPVLAAFAGAAGSDAERIRRRGYLDAAGREPFTASVAAPVLGARGDLAGAIVVSGPSHRFTPAARRRARPLLLAACADLGRRLPAAGDPAAS